MNNPWESIYLNSDPKDFRYPYPLFSLILDKLKKKKVKKILTITTGNGRHLTILSQNNMNVFGFDISKRIIELTKSNLKKLHLSATLVTSDMFKKFPYESDTFDGVIAIQAIYHGNKEQFTNAIKEARRVVKDCGPFIFTVSRSHKRSMMNSDKKRFTSIDLYTIIPKSGRESGLTHFYPNKKIINNICSKFFNKIDIVEDNDNHYFIVFCE